MIQIFNDYQLFNLNDEAPIFWPPDAKSQLIGCWERLRTGGEVGDRE